MEIRLIRHAEPEWVKDGKSVVNPPLSERGFRQAQRLGDRLKDESYDHIFVSPLLRTRQTAAPLLQHHQRAEVIEPFLEEIREPAWHGQPSEVTIKKYRDELALKAEDRWNGLEGGEQSFLLNAVCIGTSITRYPFGISTTPMRAWCLWRMQAQIAC